VAPKHSANIGNKSRRLMPAEEALKVLLSSEFHSSLNLNQGSADQAIQTTTSSRTNMSPHIASVLAEYGVDTDTYNESIDVFTDFVEQITVLVEHFRQLLVALSHVTSVTSDRSVD
jgi:hypothetical protein